MSETKEQPKSLVALAWEKLNVQEQIKQVENALEPLIERGAKLERSLYQLLPPGIGAYDAGQGIVVLKGNADIAVVRTTPMTSVTPRATEEADDTCMCVTCRLRRDIAAMFDDEQVKSPEWNPPGSIKAGIATLTRKCRGEPATDTDEALIVD